MSNGVIKSTPKNPPSSSINLLLDGNSCKRLAMHMENNDKLRDLILPSESVAAKMTEPQEKFCNVKVLKTETNLTWLCSTYLWQWKCHIAIHTHRSTKPTHPNIHPQNKPLPSWFKALCRARGLCKIMKQLNLEKSNLANSNNYSSLRSHLNQ